MTRLFADDDALLSTISSKFKNVFIILYGT